MTAIVRRITNAVLRNQQPGNTVMRSWKKKLLGKKLENDHKRKTYYEYGLTELAALYAGNAGLKIKIINGKKLRIRKTALPSC